MAHDNQYLKNEQLLLQSQEGKFPKKFSRNGLDFLLYKNVFSPLFFKGSSVYLEQLPLKEGQTFLDMGCGCGIIGIIAYKKYKLREVLCLDINPDAVDNTNENIKINNLQNYITAKQSDVFSNIDNNQKFDLIFWNAPYFDGDVNDDEMLFRSMYDKNYEHIKSFIIQGQKYINPGGKIMLGFSSSKFPIEIARNLINSIGYNFDIFYQKIDDLGFKQEILDVYKI